MLRKTCGQKFYALHWNWLPMMLGGFAIMPWNGPLLDRWGLLLGYEPHMDLSMDLMCWQEISKSLEYQKSVWFKVDEKWSS